MSGLHICPRTYNVLINFSPTVNKLVLGGPILTDQLEDIDWDDKPQHEHTIRGPSHPIHPHQSPVGKDANQNPSATESSTQGTHLD